MLVFWDQTGVPGLGQFFSLCSSGFLRWSGLCCRFTEPESALAKLRVHTCPPIPITSWSEAPAPLPHRAFAFSARPEHRSREAEHVQLDSELVEELLPIHRVMERDLHTPKVFPFFFSARVRLFRRVTQSSPWKTGRGGSLGGRLQAWTLSGFCRCFHVGSLLG